MRRLLRGSPGDDVGAGLPEPLQGKAYSDEDVSHGVVHRLLHAHVRVMAVDELDRHPVVLGPGHDHAVGVVGGGQAHSAGGCLGGAMVELEPGLDERGRDLARKVACGCQVSRAP